MKINMPYLPIEVSLFFIGIWIATLVFFFFSNDRPYKLTIALVVWSVMHSVLAFTGFYHDTSFPPRFGLVLIPAFAVIIYSILPKQRKWIMKHRDTRVSTFLHAVRLPVEIVLFQLFLYKFIPELMTYDGLNFDIIMGISAPIVGFVYLNEKMTKQQLIMWNVLGLILISFILIAGLFSANLPFQLFGFDQPNIAVIYFPFILLPATIVPIVLWTHITDIIKLKAEIKSEKIVIPRRKRKRIE